MTAVSLAAPAKINLTLEVLRRRDDGYHEVRSVMQTVELADRVILTPADSLSLTLSGDAQALAGEPPETNLAWRAAELLRDARHVRAGAAIEIEKRIPVAAGLGGGSSDAAATLRGLRELWELDVSDDELRALGAQAGSDVPFFIEGGAALVSGRGEQVAPLPEPPAFGIVLAWPERAPASEKTARMYAALGAGRYGDGSRSEALAARLRAGEPVRDGDLENVFEAVLGDVDAEAGEAFARAGGLGFGRPHLCGAGPAFFILRDPGPPVAALESLGLRAIDVESGA